MTKVSIVSDGIVINADVIPQFYQELIQDSGDLYDIITWLSHNWGIATNGFIHAEWERVCSAPSFLDWCNDEIKNGRIRRVNSQPIQTQVKKRMRIQYGFPCYSLDLQYIECAASTQSVKYIMTEDYHFYDPKCKGKTKQAKEQARECRLGRFCRFLLNNLGVRVGMPKHCKDDFSIP